MGIAAAEGFYRNTQATLFSSPWTEKGFWIQASPSRFEIMSANSDLSRQFFAYQEIRVFVRRLDMASNSAE
jgi:hypothetical protein